ncbi:nicotinate phosphoribosyltransferase-like [Limulus polyphemus]|uniref:Nicotinate phosphoribosyltransferase n=1 Tax=Limulus polyphemus TaxID=6850 RepID=A0ABM1AZY4_LIMPO|nr:nicotinate phosphoribosyltransferase-like [Limulus polyphemus]XP_022238638.1 nicotinate phosphoribosyltransferase-like [Limulus polyphemus]
MADYCSPSSVDESTSSSSDKQCQSLDTRVFSKNACCGTTTRLTNQNGVVQPLLTDLYQITMAYAYWKNGMCSNYAVFDLFFRKNPFHGEYTVFAGLDECLKFLQSFNYSHSDIEYLKSALPPTVEHDFFTYLHQLSPKDVTVYAIPEGSVVFPKIPLLRVEGPLPVVQLLETTFLTLVNYASLVATNAARFRIAAGQHIKLLEYGLRRAQGPDGGLSASKYAYMGGFDGTSNVLAGKLFNIPVKGTHAHAFVMSFSSTEDCNLKTLTHRTTGEVKDLMAICQKWLSELSGFLHILSDEASSGELAAFVSYAAAFPDSFIALIDTYDVIKSGLLNFCAVALALDELGYRALGIRIDSGDLAYLSIIAKETFNKIAQRYEYPWFSSLAVVASNDINEETILSLNEQGHKIDCFGIGTHLVTCQKQPALGCVYKLVQVNKRPCIKLSLDVEKVTIPGKKNAFRLYGQDGRALIDLLQKVEEPAPDPGKRVLCRHPFQESKRAYVLPSKVEPLYKIYWDKGKICEPLPTLQEVREHVRQSLFHLRQDIKRSLNPTPYKVSVSDDLYHFMHNLWLENAPIGELS